MMTDRELEIELDCPQEWLVNAETSGLCAFLAERNR